VTALTRLQRAQMLAHTWAHHLYPENGDVKALTMSLTDNDSASDGIGVFGMAEVDELCEALIDAIVGEKRVPPLWLALTTTVFYDKVDPKMLPVPPLAEFPTSTTKHGLMVLSVDPQGTSLFCWQVDLVPLGERVELTDEPEWSNEDGEVPRGLNVITLWSLFAALRQVGGETR